MKMGKSMYACLIASQVTLLIIISIILIDLLPTKWKICDNISISEVTSDGGMKTATVKYYTPWLGEELSGESRKSTDKSVNEYSLMETLIGISEDYIREHGIGTEITLNVISSSVTDFTYSISGAENGDEWEVWISMPKCREPLVTVYKGGAER